MNLLAGAGHDPLIKVFKGVVCRVRVERLEFTHVLKSRSLSD
jgi:hypothetical protein